MGSTLATLIEPAQYYRKLKGAQRLSGRELGVARSVCAWREHMARSADLPRSWVLKDSAVISLAKIQPRSKEELLRVKDMQGSTVRKRGSQLLELVEQAKQLPADQLPQALPSPIQPADKPSLARIQAVVKSCAEQQALAPELLMNRKQMAEATLRLLSGQQDLLPPGISQWRRQLLDVKLREIAGQ